MIASVQLVESKKWADQSAVQSAGWSSKSGKVTAQYRTRPASASCLRALTPKELLYRCLEQHLLHLSKYKSQKYKSQKCRLETRQS